MKKILSGLILTLITLNSYAHIALKPVIPYKPGQGNVVLLNVPHSCGLESGTVEVSFWSDIIGINMHPTGDTNFDIEFETRDVEPKETEFGVVDKEIWKVTYSNSEIKPLLGGAFTIALTLPEDVLETPYYLYASQTCANGTKMVYDLLPTEMDEKSRKEWAEEYRYRAIYLIKGL
jgi:hypothetical protein